MAETGLWPHSWHISPFKYCFPNQCVFIETFADYNTDAVTLDSYFCWKLGQYSYIALEDWLVEWDFLAVR